MCLEYRVSVKKDINEEYPIRRKIENTEKRLYNQFDGTSINILIY